MSSQDAKLSTTEAVLLSTAIAFFITGACLTAGLPLSQPSNQRVHTPEETLALITTSGNNSFIMVCSFLALLLVPALATLYASFRNLDVADLATKTFLTAAVIGMWWVWIIFSAVWSETTGKNGVLGVLWTHYMFKDVDYWHFLDVAPATSMITVAIFEAAFPIAACTIALSAIVERVNLVGWLFFASAWHCVVWAPVAHVIWNTGGALYTNLIMDFAGGVVVHIMAALVVLAFKLVCDRTKLTAVDGPSDNGVVSVMSLCMVFLSFFGLIAGKGHDSGPVSVQAVANVMAAAFAGALMWYGLDAVVIQKKATIVSVSQGVLLGLISATPSAGYVTIGGSFVIAIATVIFVYVGQYVTKERACQNCSLSVITLHGAGGLLGFFFTACFSYVFVNPAGYNGVMYGRGQPIAYHLAAIAIFVPCIFLATCLLMFICDLLVPLKNKEADKEVEPVATSEELVEGKQV